MLIRPPIPESLPMADATPPPNPSRRKLFAWLVDREQARKLGHSVRRCSAQPEAMLYHWSR